MSNPAARFTTSSLPRLPGTSRRCRPVVVASSGDLFPPDGNLGGVTCRAALDMWSTCEHLSSMSRMVQIRNVPDDLHRRLKARAALEGMTLSDYLLAEITRVAERPAVAELRRRLAARARTELREPAARAVRAERDGR